jgi:RND superfamily putative drug exporter
MGVGKTDPAYQAALNAVSAASQSANGLSGSLAGTKEKLGSAALVAGGMEHTLQELSSGLNRLYSGSGQLQAGIARLRAGNADLATGIGKLAGGGGQLTNGLAKLSAGAGQLEAGLDQLTNGAGALASGLSSGTGPAGQLATGLGTAESKVSKFRSDLPSPKDLDKLQKQSPGLFESGYFVLAAIDGAPTAAQTQPGFVVNLDRGGTAAQIAVVSKYAVDDERTQELGNDLRGELERFAAANATEGAVGGPAGELTDFASETQSRILLVVVALAAAIALWLMIALRSIVMPLVAVALDLLTAAAAFGVLTLLFGGDDPLLGGPGYIDPMSIIGIFAAVFGLTIVYEVMLLQRTRDELARTGDLQAALRAALRPTAYAATGAALVALAAVGPFLATDLLAVRQFGVAFAAAVVLDAFIVRPVLLPAAIALLGHWRSPKITSTPKPAV